jgi:hypothetical protein
VIPDPVDLLRPARETRVRVDPFAPTLLYKPRKGSVRVALALGDDAQQAMREALAAMRDEFGPAAWIALTVDAFTAPVDDRGVPVHEPGTLATAFASGASDVREHLSVLVVGRDRLVLGARQVYRYTVTDGWEWDEPERIEAAGASVEILLDYI